MAASKMKRDVAPPRRGRKQPASKQRTANNGLAEVGMSSTGREATVHEAKTHLSRLLAEVEAGGTVVITRRGRPVARLEGIRRRPVFGSMKGLIRFDESFFDPLPEDELRAWSGE